MDEILGSSTWPVGTPADLTLLAADPASAALWPVLVDAYPPYDTYQARCDRDIPVFICDPVT